MVARFIHLRVATNYSLSSGAITIPTLVRLAKGAGMPAIAISDSNNLFGGFSFSTACLEVGIQPILGAYLPFSIDESPVSGSLSLLVQSREGYLALIALLNAFYLRQKNGVGTLPLEVLVEHSRGLIVLSGSQEGGLFPALIRRHGARIFDSVRRLKEAFGDRFYIELQRYGGEEEDILEARLLQIALSENVPIVATHPVFFPDPSYAPAHDVLWAIADGVPVNYEKRRHSREEFYFKSETEMCNLFKDLPEALANTVAIAQRCSFILRPRVPEFPSFQNLNSEEEQKLLCRLSREHLDSFLQRTPDADGDAYRERLEYELQIIARMRYAGYFLIVADFVSWAKKHDIAVGPGRGSGSGAMVAFLLGITRIDPLRYHLFFERFLNPERVSLPDLDIDFEPDRRDEVIAYVQRRYGERHVAHIITFGSFQARAIIRDVGRALSVPYGVVDGLAKCIQFNAQHPSLLPEVEREEAFADYVKKNDLRGLVHIAKKLEGLTRHASTHAAGVVITKKTLDELLPLYWEEGADLPTTQFDMKGVEGVGMIKFDFLGLKALPIIRRCFESTKKKIEAMGKTWYEDLENLPLDDTKSYELLMSGHTFGVFQLESEGMQALLVQAKPDAFEDIIALLSLYRPGPMENIPTYVARKRGKEPIVYPDPALEAILKETYGIPIYQEQVMQIARELADYSLGEADLLRRAMGKKIPAEMQKHRTTFVQRAVSKGMENSRALNIFERMAAFAGYGFNKSHSAAYALLTYQMAYFKANEPLHFFVALLNEEIERTDRIELAMEDMARMGVRLCPPHVNRSQVEFSVAQNSVLYGLAAVKGIGSATAEAIVEERNQQGPYGSVFDFLQRNGKRVNKRILEALIKSGALKDLGHSMDDLLANLELLLGCTQKSTPAGLLFEGLKQGPSLIRGEKISLEQQIFYEREAFGFVMYRGALLGDLPPDVCSVQNLHGSGPQKVAGIFLHRRRARSRHGKVYYVVTLFDGQVQEECIVYNEHLPEGDEGPYYLLELKAQDWGSRRRWVAQGKVKPWRKKLTSKRMAKKPSTSPQDKTLLMDISHLEAWEDRVDDLVSRIAQLPQRDDGSKLGLKIAMKQYCGTIWLGNFVMTERDRKQLMELGIRFLKSMG